MTQAEVDYAWRALVQLLASFWRASSKLNAAYLHKVAMERDQRRLVKSFAKEVFAMTGQSER